MIFYTFLIFDIVCVDHDPVVGGVVVGELLVTNFYVTKFHYLLVAAGSGRVMFSVHFTL